MAHHPSQARGNLDYDGVYGPRVIGAFIRQTALLREVQFRRLSTAEGHLPLQGDRFVTLFLAYE
jgi:hypothetical protein